MNEPQLRELVAELEVRYLANQDPHLHFALITDLPDSVTKPRENDTDPLVELAVESHQRAERTLSRPARRLLRALSPSAHLQRPPGRVDGLGAQARQAARPQQVSRRRIRRIPVKAGGVSASGKRHVRYIITLDSDTQLPRGTAARRMIGAMSHPLNRAVIDPRAARRHARLRHPAAARRRQRAVGFALAPGLPSSPAKPASISTHAPSPTSTRTSTAKASSPARASTRSRLLHAVLDRRFPRNSLLSHDLIEGAYARAGLATDIEVVDDYPSHYSAYTRRKHRWVRGDWQIAQWLFRDVPDESGKQLAQPHLHHLALEDLRQPAPLAGGALHDVPADRGLARAERRPALLDA